MSGVRKGGDRGTGRAMDREGELWTGRKSSGQEEMRK